MRRLLAPLAIGGAVAALALVGGPTEAPASTRDVLPVFVGNGSMGVFLFEVTAASHESPATSLAVFRRPKRMADVPPSQLRELLSHFSSPGFTPQLSRTRLLLARGSVRIYALPTAEGQICSFLDPVFAFTCVPDLYDGGTPEVRAHTFVWGLLDDDASGVDVRVRHRWLHAARGRNAYFLRLPRGVAAPDEIVIREHSGVRHVWVIKRCRELDSQSLAFFSPLGAPPTC